MIPYAREAGAVVLLALLGLGGWKAYQFGYTNGHNAANVRAEQIIGEFHKAERDATERARKAERAAVEAHAEIAARERDKQREIEAAVERRTADLAAGNRRLRHEIGALYTERLSRDSAASGQLSPAAERGAELVSAAVGVGAECDARQAALIQAYETLRRPAPPDPE